MSTLLADLRLAFRALLRAPGFTAAALVCLALGIGANVTVFSAVYGILLRPLPFTDPDAVVTVRLTEQGHDAWSYSWPDYQDLGTADGAFAATGAFSNRTVNLGGVDEPERLVAGRVTAGLLPLVGLRPALGRGFLPDEEDDGKVVLLGDGVWRRRFGADSGVVGRSVQVNGEPYTVIGVMGPGIRFPEQAELWLPMGLGEMRTHRAWRGFQLFARLAPGVTREAADRRVKAVMARIAERYPDTNKDVSGRVLGFRDDVADSVGPVMLVMLGAVAFVLLIACANVANLLLVRGTSRTRELAVRTALGASRARIVGQLLVESLLLAVGGAALGVLLGAWGIDAVVRSLPPDLPYWMQFDVNGPVLLYTAGLSLLTVLAAGLAPALHVTGSELTASLKEGGRGSGTGTRAGRLRASLIVGEIALSVVLLVGALLMIRSFLHQRVGDPGFATREGVQLNMALAGPRYANDSVALAAYDRLVARLAAIPGVASAAITSQLPIAICCSSVPFVPEGSGLTTRTAPYPLYSVVSPGYFATMGIRVVAGRTFSAADGRGAPLVAVIDQALAAQLWPGQNPVGQRYREGDAGDTSARPITIVGVVGNVKQQRLTEAWRPHVYVPHAQWPDYRAMQVVVKTTLPAEGLLRPVRDAIREIDPDLPVAGLMTLDAQIAKRTFDSRIYGSMFGAFGLVALFLASVGLFGVMSYSVAQRRHELGVRLALGARPGDLLRLVVGQGARLAVVGLLIGVPAAFALARLLRGALYGVTPSDATTFGVVTLLLGSVAVLASWLPARRAARVDPAQALRND